MIERLSLKFVWSNSIGLSRTLLALATLITLLFNPFNQLFNEGTPACDALGISIFCLLKDKIWLLKSFCFIVLSLVIMGWRPRFTCLLHWWISYSFANSGAVIDGGDHICVILTTLLIPVCLTDSRKWHWNYFNDLNQGDFSYLFAAKSIMASTTLFVIKVQVSFIYLHSAVAKVSVKEWLDGTALYYWFTHPVFGANDTLKPILLPIVTHEYISAYLTWLVILFEFSLFAGIFMNKKTKTFFFVLGIAFHFGIFLLHGLFTFFLVMSSALILYLHPEHNPKLLRLSDRTLSNVSSKIKLSIK